MPNSATTHRHESIIQVDLQAGKWWNCESSTSAMMEFSKTRKQNKCWLWLLTSKRYYMQSCKQCITAKTMRILKYTQCFLVAWHATMHLALGVDNATIKCDVPTSSHMPRTWSNNLWFVLSAIPFCYSVSSFVNWHWIQEIWINYWNCPKNNSLLRSLHTTSIFMPSCNSTINLNVLKHSNAWDFSHKNFTQM